MSWAGALDTAGKAGSATLAQAGWGPVAGCCDPSDRYKVERCFRWRSGCFRWTKRR